VKSKIAFLTTVFPMEKKYITDFFVSLQNQTSDYFDVIVVNDGYENFEDIIAEYSDLNIIELKFSDTPAKNREFGITFVKESEYDILVFGDSDDYYSPNRIQVSVDKLKTFDIVVNDLSLFNEKGITSNNYISNRVENNTEIDLSYIQDKNIFGMSNTAVKVNIIDSVIFDEELLAVDWYFFSVLLSKKYTAVFTNESISYYRQYINNIIGLGTITKKSILKGISVKSKHYELMKKENTIFDTLLIGIYELQKKVKDVKYIEKLKNNSVKNSLWWEEIQNIK
jgi:glycosyltransferase involved in cell wall biosynthesis